MKCAECEKAGERSIIRFVQNVSNKPMDVFYDEDGLLHQHNPNFMVTIFTCSRGHRWERVDTTKCGRCDFESKP